MCDRIFITQENLDAHVRTHTSQHTCVECARLFENVEDLSQHMITEHKRSARNQCRVCKKGVLNQLFSVHVIFFQFVTLNLILRSFVLIPYYC